MGREFKNIDDHRGKAIIPYFFFKQKSYNLLYIYSLLTALNQVFYKSTQYLVDDALTDLFICPLLISVLEYTLKTGMN